MQIINKICYTIYRIRRYGDIMLENIKITINGKLYDVKKGITLLELSKMYQSDFLHKIIIAKVDSDYHELSDVITRSCKIEFFDLTTPYANRVYLNGLIFLANFCFTEIFHNKGYLLTKYSADKGLYIESTCKLTKEMVRDLEIQMLQVVRSNVRIHKVTISRDDAINYFNQIGDVKKAVLISDK